MTKPPRTPELERSIAVGEPTPLNVQAAFVHLSPEQRVLVKQDLRFVALCASYEAAPKEREEVAFSVAFPVFFDLYSDGGVRVRLGSRHTLTVDCDDHELLLALTTYLSVADNLIKFPDRSQIPSMAYFAGMTAIGALVPAGTLGRTLLGRLCESKFVEGRLPVLTDDAPAFTDEKKIAPLLANWHRALFQSGSTSSHRVMQGVVDLLAEAPQRRRMIAEKLAADVDKLAEHIAEWCEIIRRAFAADTEEHVHQAQAGGLLVSIQTALFHGNARFPAIRFGRVASEVIDALALIESAPESKRRLLGTSLCEAYASLRRRLVDYLGGKTKELDLS